MRRFIRSDTVARMTRKHLRDLRGSIVVTVANSENSGVSIIPRLLTIFYTYKDMLNLVGTFAPSGKLILTRVTYLIIIIEADRLR
jgi:hypothetical protein